jgi:hypothetical protein
MWMLQRRSNLPAIHRYLKNLSFFLLINMAFVFVYQHRIPTNSSAIKVSFRNDKLFCLFGPRYELKKSSGHGVSSTVKLLYRSGRALPPSLWTCWVQARNTAPVWSSKLFKLQQWECSCYCHWSIQLLVTSSEIASLWRLRLAAAMPFQTSNSPTNPNRNSCFYLPQERYIDYTQYNPV